MLLHTASKNTPSLSSLAGADLIVSNLRLGEVKGAALEDNLDFFGLNLYALLALNKFNLATEDF